MSDIIELTLSRLTLMYLTRLVDATYNWMVTHIQASCMLASILLGDLDAMR